jgi:hypothetical protein
VGDQRDAYSGGRHRALAPDDCRLRLEQVLASFDDDRVHAAVDHACGLLLVRVAQNRITHVTERRQLRPRPDRSENPTRPIRRGPVSSDVLGQRRSGLRELPDPVDDVVLGQVGPVSAEGIGLHGVGSRPEIGVMHAPDDVRPGHIEDLVTALEPREIVDAQVGRLKHGAHRAVSDNDPLLERIEQ